MREIDNYSYKAITIREIAFTKIQFVHSSSIKSKLITTMFIVSEEKSSSSEICKFNINHSNNFTPN